jgi:glycosyltransferase involved in cell wall biosynthesis
MANPRFTFCIPNLNKIDFLPACIESMLAQDSGDWCCVFVDGFSTDGCWEYMEQFADDPRFRLMRGLKQGMYADWNYCLAQVETEYFYILTSDDTCYASLVTETTAALDEFSDIDVCHFQYALIDDQGAVTSSPAECTRNRCSIYSDVNRYAHRRSGACELILHYVYGALYTTLTSLVFRSSLLDKIHGFSQEYGSVGDYDWTMRLGLFTDVLYIPSLLATWRIYPEQATLQTSQGKAIASYMKIGQKNISALRDLRVVDISDEAYLLSKLRDSYIASQMHGLLKRGVGSALEVLRLDSSYPFRKLLRRLTFNRLYPYDDERFARGVIDRFGLCWPPERVEPGAEGAVSILEAVMS